MNLYTIFGSRFLFPLHERLKGHETLAILKDLERSQWLSSEQLQTLQAQRLSDFLSKIRDCVPYFRNQRCLATTKEEAIPNVILQRLPITDKAQIRRNFENWSAEDTVGLTQCTTSGSSGEPLLFLLSKHRISFDIAAKWRAMRWWNVDIGDREMVFWGSSIETSAQDRVRRVRDHLLRSRLVPARDLSPGRIDEILAEMRSFRPRMLFGYPSALSRIAARARERRLNMRDLGIRVAFCTSEVLRPEWRNLIADTFGCGVANEYGARDAGFIARECPSGSLHVTAEEIIVEIVDDRGQPVPPGVEGEILVTNLAGPEFPFVRYRTGDRGRLAGTSCPCGRGLPLLEEITGRSNDGLVSETGAWIHGSAINHLLRDTPGLKAYRIIQDSLHTLEIRLVLDHPLERTRSGWLTEQVRQLLGSNISICIREVANIPPLANGKFRHIICNVSRPDGDPRS